MAIDDFAAVRAVLRNAYAAWATITFAFLASSYEFWALPGLPQISKRFSEGKISYSKVRAMTRVATRRRWRCATD